MIQRKQTLYLIWVLALSVAGVIILLYDKFSYSISGAGLIVNYYWLLIPFLLSAIDAGSAIFLYKKRKMQMHMCTYIMVVNIFIIIVSAFLLYLDLVEGENTNHNTITPAVYILLGIGNLIFSFLARKKINADEKLIKSVDRIR